MGRMRKPEIENGSDEEAKEVAKDGDPQTGGRCKGFEGGGRSQGGDEQRVPCQIFQRHCTPELDHQAV